MTTVEQDVTVRPASIADRPSVLALLESSLGWETDSRNADLFAWKHEQSPFGPSPAWVALDREGQLLGFRTFLRWEFTRGSAVVRAARAVDTATRPDVQRRGIFSRLTMTSATADRNTSACARALRSIPSLSVVCLLRRAYPGMSPAQRPGPPP